MNPHVIAAIFRRNFTSYFSNPTGYVFICVFVLLGSFAAFWPDEFFNANLANLEQLNKWFPYIMLVFIPAITMSIWADEKRQGTDELLLTIPATDFDVVLGKYFAAVAIYSVALLFSFICNLIVLRFLGHPDVGLFLGTYFGYGMVGLAMLAVGMVASFLTGNLTVAFILGVVFNAPLVFLNVIDTVVRPTSWTATVKGWSVGEQMSDFGRGVISLSSIVYFLMIAVLMLYLCMVLIGRRHWLGGKNGVSVGPHYLVRALALLALAIGVTLVTQNFNLRADATEERLNSLSPQTLKMIKELKPDHQIVIEAYLSPHVPEEFVQTRIDLVNQLKEFEKISGGKIKAKIYPDVEPLTDAAQRAEQQFGIMPQKVIGKTRGVYNEQPIFLGAAITCGLEKIIVPFFERGVPVEYELLRSISTVSQQERKKLGIVSTDVELFGGMDMMSFRPRQKEKLIEELEKQYDVVRVDPNAPITEKYDVLLAVQPSSLTAVQMKNFCEAIRSGVPTAIFEDPLPTFMPAPGTGQPRRPRQQGMMGMMGGQQPPEPKGDIKQLWNLLGVELLEKSSRGLFGDLEKDYAVVWHDFKPPKLSGLDEFTPEYVFVRRDAPEAKDAFNETDPASAGLQQLLLLFPGGIMKRNAAKTEFKPLLKTGKSAGTIMVKDVMSSLDNPPELRAKEGAVTKEHYILAAHITGAVQPTDAADEAAKADDAANGEEKKEEKSDSKDDTKSADDKSEKKPGSKPHEINVILVSDIDMLISAFFNLRAQRMENSEFDQVDNVTFVLNVIDVLAGDNRFLESRTRRPWHRALEEIVNKTQDARDKKENAVREFKQKVEKRRAELEQEFKNAQDSLNADLAQRQKEGNLDYGALQQRATEIKQQLDLKQRQKDEELAQEQRKLQKDIDLEDIQLNNAVRSVQDDYKMWSVILPPIPPLVVAFFVYFNRRAKEREGVSKSRLK